MKKWIKILVIPLVLVVLIIFFTASHKYQTDREKNKSAAPPAPKQIKAPLKQGINVQNRPILFTPKQTRSPLKPAPSKKMVIYFSPHPDDEVLTFGIAILNDIRAGKMVYLVL